MWFEGKWTQLEGIMLSVVNQDQKHKIHIFSHVWKIDPKINVYTKTVMIIYKLRCRTCLQQWSCSMELREREKAKENNGTSVISHNIRYEGRGYKDVY
jgi:hypothetical protein